MVQPFILPKASFITRSQLPLQVIANCVALLLFEDNLEIFPPRRGYTVVSTRNQFLPSTIFGK